MARLLHDPLASEIEVCRLRLRLERVRLNVARSPRMTPKLKGIAPAMDKVRHELDMRADQLAARIEATRQHGVQVFDSAHKTLDSAESALNEVDQMISDVGQTNGGPPLDASSPSSTADQDVVADPAKVAVCAWAGQQFRAELIEQTADGSWRARALEKHPRFAAGTVITVKPAEIVEMPKGTPDAQA